MNPEKISIEDTLKRTTTDLVSRMGFNSEIEVLENIAEAESASATDSTDSLQEGSHYVVSIRSEDNLGVLIGKNGQNIRALEQVVRAISYKELPENTNFMLDINNYRKARASYVIEQAKTIANRVKESQRSEALFPMSSYERRLVHMELASFADVLTESVGNEPNRRVIVKPQI